MPIERGYRGDPLRVILTLTNLRGVAYSVQVTSIGGRVSLLDGKPPEAKPQHRLRLRQSVEVAQSEVFDPGFVERVSRIPFGMTQRDRPEPAIG
jgi:hypothetical protein